MPAGLRYLATTETCSLPMNPMILLLHLKSNQILPFYLEHSCIPYSVRYVHNILHVDFVVPEPQHGNKSLDLNDTALIPANFVTELRSF